MKLRCVSTRVGSGDEIINAASAPSSARLSESGMSMSPCAISMLNGSPLCAS